jgi:glycosyltransferase involved in cell wall biosynthesis
MSAPLVSVVLPVRDGARYLAAAIGSVLEQTHHELELVVVDDGSADATAAIVAAVDDERVLLVRQDAGGVAAALDRGLAASSGPYVARMDADDLSLPERIARQLAFLERRPSVGLVVSGVQLIDEAGQDLDVLVLPARDADLRRRLLLRNPITHGAVLMRREAVEGAGGYRSDYGANEDYDLWRRIARDWELAAMPDVLYRHRLHAAAVTETDRERVAKRDALRDELWHEPALVRALWGERDTREAKALVREALCRRRPRLAARAGAGYIAARFSSE